jgi:hypothetical protein
MTSILTASAKFFRPNLYRHLLSHAQMLLNRETSAGSCNIAIIKSLLIVVFWKDPTDKSASIKIGIACRLGFQLGLHLDPGKGGDDAESRDATRTWSCESCRGYMHKETEADPRSGL